MKLESIIFWALLCLAVLVIVSEILADALGNVPIHEKIWYNRHKVSGKAFSWHPERRKA